MTTRIIADSGCDLTEELKERMNVVNVPLSIMLGDTSYIDDDNLDTKNLLKLMRENNLAPTTACPSPEDYAREFRKADVNYVITLSSQLSGSYNSAMLAKDMVLKEDASKKIHVFDSKSAAAGETKIACEIYDRLKSFDFEAMVKEIEERIKNIRTFFILQTLDYLMKAGRISKLAGSFAGLLSIKPIMGEDGNGNIISLDKCVGTKKAFERLYEIIAEKTKVIKKFANENDMLVITHCNCYEKALNVKENLLLKCENVKKILIVPSKGISTVYANDGGIVISC